MIAKIHQLTQPYIEVFITKPFTNSSSRILQNEHEILYQLEVSKIDPFVAMNTTSTSTDSSKDYLKIIYIVIPAVFGLIVILILLIAIIKIKKKKIKRKYL
jgi:glucan phosphoethanolaminetransferase (alkaline phosphatase superfamily)